jgi:LysR family hydrogen peroxide-inducible transcriptional activator
LGWLAEAKIHGHFEKLAYFFTVARVGTINGAASELRISQPSLTIAMQHLEDALGVELMVRSRQGIRLTAAGKRLMAEGEPLMRNLAHLAGSVQRDSTQLTGKIRCCTHEIVAGIIWPPVMNWAHENAPGLDLELETTRSTREMIDRLINLEQDVCIVAEAPLIKSVQRIEIFHDHYGFFATEKFLSMSGISVKKTNKRVTVQQANLSKLPMIFPSKVIAGPNITLDAMLERQQLPITSKFNIKTLETALVLATSGLGVALAPRLFVNRALGAELLELTIPELKGAALGAHSYHACFRSADTHDFRIEALVAALKDQLGRPTERHKNGVR